MVFDLPFICFVKMLLLYEWKTFRVVYLYAQMYRRSLNKSGKNDINVLVVSRSVRVPSVTQILYLNLNSYATKLNDLLKEVIVAFCWKVLICSKSSFLIRLQYLWNNFYGGTKPLLLKAFTMFFNALLLCIKRSASNLLGFPWESI